MNPHRLRLILLMTLALVISLTLPVLLGGQMVLARLFDLPWSIVLILIGMVLLGWLFNSLRLRLLAGSMGIGLPFGWSYLAVIAVEFAAAASPAGVGGALTYVALLRRHGIRTAHSAAMYAIDHFLDGLFFTVAFPLALISLVLHGGFSSPGWLMAITLVLFGFGSLLFWSVLHRHRWLIKQFGRMIRFLRLSGHSRRRLARWLIQFRHGVQLVLRLPLPKLLLLFMLCAGHWLLRYSILAVIITAIGSSVPWSYLFVVQGALLLIGQIILLPGGVGGVEVGYAALLAPFLSKEAIGLSLLLWRLMTYHFYLVVGLPVFLALVGSQSWYLLSPQRSSEN